jgi:serine/threonine protein kinase
MPAQIISHYHIMGTLGIGGMGSVYRAEDGARHCTMAPKFLPESVAHTEKVYKRLKRKRIYCFSLESSETSTAAQRPWLCSRYVCVLDSAIGGPAHFLSSGPKGL